MYKCYIIISITLEKVTCKREISRDKRLKQRMIEYQESYRVPIFIYLFVVIFLFLHLSDTWHAALREPPI